MVTLTCKVCTVPFTNDNQEVLLCGHHEGFVHVGCCTDVCSQHGTPCEHHVATFVKK
ncbi:MAG: hypothetical protein ABIJ21_03325 [Nanoarchaeota archaeon]